MEKLVFATKLNGTDDTGIINTKTHELFCLCTKEVGERILKSLEKAKSYDELEDKIEIMKRKIDNYEMEVQSLRDDVQGYKDIASEYRDQARDNRGY